MPAALVTLFYVIVAAWRYGHDFRAVDLPADRRGRRSAMPRARSVSVAGRNHGFADVWSREIRAELQSLDRHCCRIRPRHRHLHLHRK